VPYNFRQIPEVGTVEELRQWLSEELKLISESLNESTELELRASKHEPERPREGMIVHADGTAWNPGGGAGTYRYQNGLWVKIPIAGTDVVTGQASSVDGEIALFSGTSGKALKRATGTGLVKATAGVYSTGVAANADLADMAAWTIKMRNSGSTGAPQDQTVNDLTEETTGDAAADFALMWDASGSVMRKMKPNNFGIATGGLTLITSGSFPAAATWSFTNLGGYKFFIIGLRGVSQSSGTSRVFQVALSGNNGSSYGTARQPVVQSLVSGSASNGFVGVSRVDQTNNQLIMPLNAYVSGATNIETGSLGPINALQFSWSGAATNFTAGDIDIYGLK
jgi:hypothetical protein